MKSFRSRDHDPEKCPGCRPLVFDPKTGERSQFLTEMAGKVYDAAPPEQRRAWHRVTCLNSRDLRDIDLSSKIIEALQKAVAN
jgi:hypothetical protein